MPQTQLKDERPRTDETGPVDRRKGEARTDIGERQKTRRAGGRWRRPLAIAAVAVFFVLAAAGGAIWWANARQYESTDDAYIDARSVSISSQLAGAIVNAAADPRRARERPSRGRRRRAGLRLIAHCHHPRPPHRPAAGAGRHHDGDQR
jgi:hypothetical protein